MPSSVSLLPQEPYLDRCSDLNRVPPARRTGAVPRLEHAHHKIGTPWPNIEGTISQAVRTASLRNPRAAAMVNTTKSAITTI